MDPGDNLEFKGSDYFEDKVKEAPDLRMAVETVIRNRPNSGITVAGIMKELVVTFGDQKSVVFFVRRGNHIGLTAIFGANETVLIEEKRAELKVLFGKGGKL